MASDDVVHLLDVAAHTGRLDSSEWPRLLRSVLSRLDDIVQHVFPKPTMPQARAERPPFSQLTSQNSIDSVPPTSPSRIESSQQTEIAPVVNSNNTSTSQSEGILPDTLQSFYESIRSNLSNAFAEKPPYTIQRLAELLLSPERHYKTLPAFLRAVDRVVSVSSTADVFPLPYIATDTNGVLGSGPDDFNGAALTRIPWLGEGRLEWGSDGEEMMGVEGRPAGVDLRTESTSVIDGPNGAGSIETVTVAMNGTARNQESSKGSDSTTASHGSDATNSAPETPETIASEQGSTEETPHARGPEEIGMEDMGPQAAALTTEPGPADSIQAAERAVGRPGEAERLLSPGAEGDKMDDKPDPSPEAQESKKETESKP